MYNKTPSKGRTYWDVNIVADSQMVNSWCTYIFVHTSIYFNYSLRFKYLYIHITSEPRTPLLPLFRLRRSRYWRGCPKNITKHRYCGCLLSQILTGLSVGGWVLNHGIDQAQEWGTNHSNPKSTEGVSPTYWNWKCWFGWDWGVGSGNTPSHILERNVTGHRRRVYV